MKTLATLFLSALVLSGCQRNVADQLAEIATGTFDNQDEEDRLVEKRIRVEMPEIGKYVFYQQLNHRAELEVYRQRILVWRIEDGALWQTAYSFKEPEQYVDASPEDFTSLTMDALEATLPDGCDMRHESHESGFRGYIDAKDCVITSSRTGKLRGIEAEAIIGKDQLQLAERGYDAETGEKLFGTEPGEYLILKRLSD